MKKTKKYKLLVICFGLHLMFHTITLAQDYPKLPFGNSDSSSVSSYQKLEKVPIGDLKVWYDRQNEIALESLDKAILKRARKGIDKIYPKGGNYVEMVTHADGKMFYLEDRNIDGLDEIYAMASEDKKGSLVFDARKYLENDWEKYNLDYYQPSWDGRYVAVALKPKGDSYSEVIIIDNTTGDPLPKKIYNTDPRNVAGISWGPNSKSFLVNHYTQSDKDHPDYHITNERVLHRLDGFPDNSKVVFNHESYNGIDKNENTNARLLSPEDNYVIGNLPSVEWYTDGFITNTQDIFKGEPQWKPFFKREDKVDPVGFHNYRFYFISGKDSNRSLCSVDANNPDFDNPEILVPANDDKVLRSAAMGSGGIYFDIVKNGVTANLLRYNFDGDTEEVSTDYNPGNIKFFTSSNDGPIYAMMYSWTESYDRYLIEGNRTILHPLAYDMGFPMFENLAYDELEYSSHDGTKVPLSLVYMKGSKPNTNTPVFLYSYGVYGLSVSPNFRETWYSWIINGGVMAFAHIRGGGEKGDAWHEAGKTVNRQNSWQDLIAAAEYLIDNNITSKGKIALHGESGGAVASGMAINERPELFGCYVVSKGVLNPKSFVESNLGKKNYREFGSNDISKEAEALVAMDPFINITKQDYPAIYAITALSDERVPYWLTFKYIAKMQRMDTSNESPVVMRVLEKATHTNFGELGYDEAYSEMFAFCYEHLGVKIK